jgi:eukaryotic-like serine/threonine-protein kinase
MSFCPACGSEYPGDWKRCPKDESSLLGSRRVGKYEVEAILGTGGMGTVYRAQNPDTRSPVAVKVLHAHAAKDEQSRARFQREAAAVAALTTRHVCKVYDFGEEEDGTLYLVLELLRGHTLRAEIRRPPDQMPVQRIHLAVDGALRGLAAAHRAGIVHRDLKPENVFLADTDDGEVTKLLDFGIARVDRPEEKALTQSGAVIGTPAYMGPEQIASSRGEVGPWSDVYAIGVILYEMLTGEVPFAAPTVTEVLSRVLERDFPSLAEARPDLPASMHALIERALAADPEARYPDAGEMHRAFAEAYDELGSEVTGAPLPPFSGIAADGVDPHSETDIGSPATDPTMMAIPDRRAARSLPRLALVLVPLVAASLLLWWIVGSAGDDRAPPEPPDAAPRAVAPDASGAPIPTEMALLAGGAFEMGVPPELAEEYQDADPAHTVSVRPFLLDRTEYTEPGAEIPLTGVTWDEALARCKALGKRLPSEAEWEFAATRGRLDPRGARMKADGVHGPAPVGTHDGDCTPDGICDLLGNVVEWTGDPWRVRGGGDPEVDVRYRTARGGSYGVAPDEPFYASPHARLKLGKGERYPEVGFRCARDAGL